VRRRMSLAGQLLALQLTIVSAVLVAVAAVSLAQSDANFQATERPRVRSAAETVADEAVVRLALADPSHREVGQSAAAAAESFSGASYVIIATADRTVIASPDPGQLGTKLDLRRSTVLQGRTWVGVISERESRVVVAHAPVLSTERGHVGEVTGVVAVGREYPTRLETLRSATPNLLTYLGMASLLGIAGSYLVARRVKRQTFGMEPREIASLLEHREAVLHGIREGMVALDAAGRLTAVNDEARRLLGLPDDIVGRSLDEVDVPSRVRDVLSGVDGDGKDSIVLRHGRVLVLNRMPVSVGGKGLGAVVTLRDRTELDTLLQELEGARSTTDALRAQAHEFSNRMHTIGGLIELGEYEEALRFATSTSAAHDELSRSIADRVAEPAVAALLLAKAAAATEHGARLEVADETRLSPEDVGDPRDLLLVVGNLVDNALDALAGDPGWVRVMMRSTPDGVVVEVRDSGPGVAADLAEEVFRHGFTTKVAQSGGIRGLGLALTRQACIRRGGWVRVRNDDGAVFTALLPRARVGAP
jgi:two-component system CitB family sensor kinase